MQEGARRKYAMRDREGPARASAVAPGVLVNDPASDVANYPGLLRRPLVDAVNSALTAKEVVKPRIPKGVPSGTVLQPIEIPERILGGLIIRSLTEQHNTIVWSEAGDEVVVNLSDTRVAVRRGVVVVGLVLAIEGMDPAEVTVPVGVGTPDQIRGLVAMTPRAPEGPAQLVLRWGDAVIATVWGALVDVIGELARAAGDDENGAPLETAAIIAEDGTLGIVLQARPDLEQILSTSRPAPERKRAKEAPRRKSRDRKGRQR